MYALRLTKVILSVVDVVHGSLQIVCWYISVMYSSFPMGSFFEQANNAIIEKIKTAKYDFINLKLRIIKIAYKNVSEN